MLSGLKFSLSFRTERSRYLYGSTDLPNYCRSKNYCITSDRNIEQNSNHFAKIGSFQRKKREK